MSVNVGRAVGYLDLDTSGFKKGFQTALSDLKVFNDTAASSSDKLAAIGSASISAGRSLTKYLTVPLAGFGALSVKTTAQFDAGMSKVQSISGATGSELEQLRNKAIEMGAKTKFSANESAEAFQYMAMAGWDTADMLDGIEGLMSLAAASGEDLATTSDIVTDALTAFGLSAADSGHFADVLAKASSRSNTNVSLMGETFKYVAPVAGALGYSIEDTAVAIGLMANAGIKGSRAGTSLRSIMTRLTKPVGEAKTAINDLGISIENADGTVKPLSQTMEELRAKFSSLTDAEKAQYAAMLAGQEGMSGLLAIVNASDADFAKLTKEINNAAGTADEMAEVMMDNLPGALEQASGAVETLMIRVGDVLTPMLIKVVNGFTSFIEKLTTASDGTVKFAVGIGVLLASIGPLLLILGHTANNILSLINLYQKLTVAQNENTVSAVKNFAARAGTNISKGIKNLTLYTMNLVKNTASTIANTTAQITSAVATTRVGVAFSTAASRVLAFTAANKVAILTVAGLLAPILILIAYMQKTGSSAEEVANKITSFADNLANKITSLSEQFPTLVNSLVSVITKLMDALAKTLPKAITTVISTIPKLIPLVIQAGIQLFMGLVQSMQEVIEPIVEAIPSIIDAIVEAIVVLAPAILQAGVTLLTALVQAIPQIIPPLIAAIPKIVTAIVGVIPTLIPELIQGAIQLFMAFVEAIPQVIPALLKAAPQIVRAIIQGVLTLSGTLFTTGVSLLKQLWQGIASWVGTLGSNVAGAVKGLPNRIRSGIGNLFSIGKDWIMGLWEGIKAKKDELLGKIESLGNTIKKKVKSAFKISSPSRWMRDMIGKMMMVGWAKGLVENVKVVIRSIVDNAKKVKSAYEENAVEVSPEDLLFDPEDFEPYTPKPVNQGGLGVQDNTQSYTEGDTFNFYSPVALTPMEAAKQMKKAKRDLALGY